MAAESLPVWGALVGAPVVSGIVQAVKYTGKVPGNFLPLIAIGVGVVLGLIAYLVSKDPLMVVSGLSAGLSAPGVYEATNKVVAVMQGDTGTPPEVNP